MRNFTITPAVADKSEGVQLPILPHVRRSRSSANYRYGHLESNALIKIEFGEFCQKLKNLEFRQNSIFWESLGVIWIDSMSLGVVPPLSFFFLIFFAKKLFFPGRSAGFGFGT